ESVQVALRWEKQVSLEMAAGAAPLHGVLPGRATGVVDVSATPAWGQANISLASAPVRETVLSWSGMADPLDGRPWGRVFRHGLDARVLWLAAAPWSVGLHASA